MPQILLLQTSLSNILTRILASEGKEARHLLSVTMQERSGVAIRSLFLFAVNSHLVSFIFVLPFISSLVLILDNQVAYDTSGFLEKNRDLLHMDSIQLLAKCKTSLPKMFASKMLVQPDDSMSVPYRSSAADSQKLSVAMKFKVQILHSQREPLC